VKFSGSPVLSDFEKSRIISVSVHKLLCQFRPLYIGRLYFILD